VWAVFQGKRKVGFPSSPELNILVEWKVYWNFVRKLSKNPLNFIKKSAKRVLMAYEDRKSAKSVSLSFSYSVADCNYYFKNPPRQMHPTQAKVVWKIRINRFAWE
jgi:hypothetical protein